MHVFTGIKFLSFHINPMKKVNECKGIDRRDSEMPELNSHTVKSTNNC